MVDDGRKAMEACPENQFDLVLMDIQMPEMDGFEALASIRSSTRERGCTHPSSPSPLTQCKAIRRSASRPASMVISPSRSGRTSLMMISWIRSGRTRPLKSSATPSGSTIPSPSSKRGVTGSAAGARRTVPGSCSRSARAACATQSLAVTLERGAVGAYAEGIDRPLLGPEALTPPRTGVDVQGRTDRRGEGANGGGRGAGRRSVLCDVHEHRRTAVEATCLSGQTR